MKLIERFDEISGQFDALFFDVWGCLHNGIQPYPAAVRALETYVAGGGIVVLITNSPRSGQAVEDQVNEIGVPRHVWHRIVTSGDAAKSALLTGQVGRKVHHIGPKRDLEFFETGLHVGESTEPIERVPLENAEGIVCTGLFDDLTETPEDYREILGQARQANLKLLCVNPDIVVDRGSFRSYCAGALARLYCQLGGEVLLFGKPRATIYQLARKMALEIRGGTSDKRTLCVGDGIETDIRGAAGQGLASLFVSGGIAAAATGTIEHPDLAKLDKFLKSAGFAPDFVIGRFN